MSNTTNRIFYATTGGQGVTTVAITLAYAIGNALFDGRVRLWAPTIEGVNDILITLGMERDYQAGDEITLGMGFTLADHPEVNPYMNIYNIADYGQDTPTSYDQATLVLRPHYLPLRKAVKSHRPESVVLVKDNGAALTQRDIEDVLGIEISEVIEYDPQIARAADAGTLTLRVPNALKHAFKNELRSANV